MNFWQLFEWYEFVFGKWRHWIKKFIMSIQFYPRQCWGVVWNTPEAWHFPQDENEGSWGSHHWRLYQQDLSMPGCEICMFLQTWGLQRSPGEALGAVGSVAGLHLDPESKCEVSLILAFIWVLKIPSKSKLNSLHTRVCMQEQ